MEDYLKKPDFVIVKFELFDKTIENKFPMRECTLVSFRDSNGEIKPPKDKGIETIEYDVNNIPQDIYNKVKRHVQELIEYDSTIILPFTEEDIAKFIEMYDNIFKGDRRFQPMTKEQVVVKYMIANIDSYFKILEIKYCKYIY